jgi:N-methylhydantoinase A
MQSNGGMATFAGSARKAVATVYRPGRRHHGEHADLPHDGLLNLITFDMGGTSCDVALIKDGEPSVQTGKIDGRDISSHDRHQHGERGGGTLARVDRFGHRSRAAKRRRCAGACLLRAVGGTHHHRLQSGAGLSR